MMIEVIREVMEKIYELKGLCEESIYISQLLDELIVNKQRIEFNNLYCI